MAPASANAPGPEAPLGKVELDLEGAPFLEPDPAEAPEEAATEVQTARAVEEGGVPKKSRKKLFILLGAALLVVFLLGAGSVYFFVLRGPGAKEGPADSAAATELPPNTKQIVIPSTPPVAEVAPVDRFSITWEPFWVEVTDPEGEIRFAYYELILATNNQRVAAQVERQKVIMRDAVYYYLRHKPYSFLADPKQLELLKKEILDIVNYYIIPQTVYIPDLPQGEAPPPDAPKEKLKEVLIVDYLIK